MGFFARGLRGRLRRVLAGELAGIQAVRSIGNQWRVGAMGGVVSLDYSVLFHRMDRMKLPDDEYEQLFEDVKSLEAAALSVFQPQARRVSAAAALKRPCPTT
jgi:hypothetical protein